MRNSIMLCIMVSLAALTGLAMADVVINEVELNPPANGIMWVELYNSGQENVSVGGWKVVLMDEAWQGPMTVPEGTMISPSGFLVLEGLDTWVGHINATAILYDQNGSEIDRSRALLDERASTFTWGRLPDGKDTDTNRDWANMLGSKGKPNGAGSVRT
ncbi:MAG: hypothetical protein A4E45_00491 [Methanosaeta sp. PtaB.Bin039]|nr:MAG: hypothetical protein A4E45_00491 [Methanosaeta sp. PtaB.Bin039]HOT07192.1 lamin tail domain-containing protein [Methanotrichaceae archaeon]HQF17203.1 lamin tail domain-containing protein [Methanotrichaceae archaeon]HQI91776.1 lamin tail domain-containing protein [Methanotrichaceae archaeon]HQJ29023.1 lamin tail domain-containing protein [Methanotrichaceae archaeon]